MRICMHTILCVPCVFVIGGMVPRASNNGGAVDGLMKNRDERVTYIHACAWEPLDCCVLEDRRSSPHI